MTARAGRLLGLVLGWSVTLAAVAVGLLLAAPFVLLGWLCLVVAKVFRLLTKRAEVDGSADGGEPDALTPQLREEIDGDRQAAAERRLRERLGLDEPEPGDVLSCGCSESECGSILYCQHCPWRACFEDRNLPHHCPRDAAIRGWQNSPLPPAVAASVNDAFAALINHSDVSDLRHVDQDLAKFYVIGDER